MNDNPLAQLRDIHLPDPISFWPLAVGWYVLIILIVLSITGFLYRRWRLRWIQRVALRELQKLNSATDLLLSEKITQLSILLRRVALSYFPREAVAGLQGEAWLQFLDRTGHTQLFTQGAGRHFMSAPYDPTPAIEWNVLSQLAEHWIKRSWRIRKS